MRPVSSIAPDLAVARVRRPDFDDLGREPARRVVAAPARPEQISDLIDLATQLIPPLAAAEPAVRRVYDHNPDSIWAVERQGSVAGVFAMLFLNAVGLESLLRGTFDASSPSPGELTRPGEKASAIYFWAIATPGFAVEAFRTVSEWLAGPAYASADIYTRPTTMLGDRFAVRIGFLPLPELGLYRFRRHCNREKVTTVVA